MSLYSLERRALRDPSSLKNLYYEFLRKMMPKMMQSIMRNSGFHHGMLLCAPTIHGFLMTNIPLYDHNR
jgi:hypothetical protein